MAAIDYILLFLAVGGLVYGLLRGIRSALFLLIILMASLLGILMLTRIFESFLLSVSPLDPEAYADAPAVAAFLLEGEKGFAFAAALFPSFVTLFLLLVLTVGSRLLKSFIPGVDCRAGCRVSGAFAGLLAGVLAVLLLGIQLIRLPWPPGAALFRGSVIYAALEQITGSLLPLAAGGWPYV